MSSPAHIPGKLTRVLCVGGIRFTGSGGGNTFRFGRSAVRLAGRAGVVAVDNAIDKLPRTPTA